MISKQLLIEPPKLQFGSRSFAFHISFAGGQQMKDDVIDISESSKSILLDFKKKTADFQELTNLLDDKLIWSKTLRHDVAMILASLLLNDLIDDEIALTNGLGDLD
jgi:hypothetical protein